MLNIDDRLIKEVLPQIKPNAFSVLMAISVHLNTETGTAFPSNQTLQKITGLGRDSVEKAILALKEAGLIKAKADKKTPGRFGKRVIKVSTSLIGRYIPAEKMADFEEDSPYPENQGLVEQNPEIPCPDFQGTNILISNNIGENANEYAFSDFWNDYDYKVGSKIKAKKSFEKLKPLEREQIRETLDMYKADTSTVETTGKDFKRMRKHPEFYLSGKIWETYSERLAAQKAENETFAPEWTDEYEKYIEWVKKCYPKSLKAAKYLSKQQYVRYKTTFYVEGKSFIDEKREREFLIQAHDDVENNDDLRARVTDIFSYHCELIKERLKMYQI